MMRTPEAVAQSDTETGKTADPHAVADEVVGGLRDTAEQVVPWFMQQMPLMYFQDTDHAAQISHLRAIIAARASGRPIDLSMVSEDGLEWTFMRPVNHCGVLAELSALLPDEKPLRAAKIHTANDGELVLDTFVFGEAPRFDPNDPIQKEKLDQALGYLRNEHPEESVEDFSQYLHRCSADYVSTVTPLRLAAHWKLVQSVSGTDGTTVSLEPEKYPGLCRIVCAVSNARTRMMLERIATRLSKSNINIHRAYLDRIDDGPNGSIALLGFVCQDEHGEPLDKNSDLWKLIRHDLTHIKWVDQRTLDLDYRQERVNLLSAEIINALCDLSHQTLIKQNPYAFSQDRIMRMAERNIEQSAQIAELFLERFNPNNALDDQTFERRCQSMRQAFDSSVDLEDARTVLQRMLDCVRAVYRTNVYVEDRYALGMRIDPALMSTKDRQNLPYGVFFVHGREFNGFHVRFRDIARGGVRAVRPFSAEQHAREAERLYDEAYQLAFAQQLKNKDIPEGGSKAAILLEPGADVNRGVKAFVDTLLDLITPDADTKSQIVDRLGVEELLYLGPDENITPDLINWIVDRARRRGYGTPTALMSSKPGAGINHKEYGVTSEGVNVFLDVALRAVGVDPKNEKFTVKITGGPDGDVAGNMIRILRRDYGENGRIIGIADGSGAGEDPEGLDYDELMRLVENTLPIASFDRSKLSKNGRIVNLDEPDGVHLRNTLHNRLVADAFVPCGGRPNAIHSGNWKEYLTEDGRPSSKVIVEGANLFLTPDARVHLSDAGTLILKDSSANKCGVICSSYEIIACMLLSEEEIMATKETFVAQVLDRLRALARREAELLLRVYKHMPHVPLPVISIRLSEVMIRTADAIERAIDELSDDDKTLLRSLVIDHLPPVLLDRAGDRLWDRAPQTYLKWIMAKSLAARIVYREGFEYLESMPMDAISELAMKYLKLEIERGGLIKEVEKSDLPNRDRISALLTRAGILSTMGEA